MNTPMLNSLGVFISQSTMLITYVICAASFLAVVCSTIYGRNFVTVAFLQFAGALSLVLAYTQGFGLTYMIIAAVSFAIGLGYGFGYFPKGFRSVSVTLACFQALIIYLTFTDKIFQIVPSRESAFELEVFSAVLFFIAFKSFNSQYKLFGFALFAIGSMVSLWHIAMMTYNLLFASFFFATAICAILPKYGILGFIKALRTEASSAKKATEIIYNKASKRAKKQNISDKSERKDDALNNYAVLSTLDSDDLVNDDLNTFYSDSISYSHS